MPAACAMSRLVSPPMPCSPIRSSVVATALSLNSVYSEQLTYEFIVNLQQAYLLHDIGKVGIPESILLKRGKLTTEEFDEMKKHPEYGVEIMQPVAAFRHILPAMLHHHERFDGRGYPHGLAGEEIPLTARILCVADCFDAMTSDRPYRKGMPVADAVAELAKNKTTQFDPRLVDIFLKVVEQGRIEPVLTAYHAQPQDTVDYETVLAERPH